MQLLGGSKRAACQYNIFFRRREGKSPSSPLAQKPLMTEHFTKQASFLGIIQGLLLCLTTKFRTALICNQPYKQFIKTNLYSYHEKP